MGASLSSVAKRAAPAAAGVGRERVRGIHTLRHCFASHLMEDGVALPVIQHVLRRLESLRERVLRLTGVGAMGPRSGGRSQARGGRGRPPSNSARTRAGV